MPGYIKTRNVNGVSLRGIVVARPIQHALLSGHVPEIYDVVTGNALANKRKMQHRVHKRVFLDIELLMIDVPHPPSRATVSVPIYLIHERAPLLSRRDRRYQTRSIRNSSRRMARMLVQTVFAGNPDKIYMSVNP